MLVLALVAGGGLVGSSGTSAPTAPARVIDRTFLCTNAVQAGIREITVSARRGFQQSGKWEWLAGASVMHFGGASVRERRGSSDQQWAVGMAAGAGAVPEGRLGNNPGISIRSRERNSACSPSRARVRLSTRGLSGGAVDYFSDEFKCVVPRRILVRLRGVFGSPASLQPAGDPGPFRTLQANGPLQEGAIAVRTQAGKPLLFATVSESGRARLFTARSCA